MKISQKYYRIIAILLLLLTWFMPIFISFIIALLGNDYMDVTDVAKGYIYILRRVNVIIRNWIETEIGERI